MPSAKLQRIQAELDTAGQGSPYTFLTDTKKTYETCLVLALDMGLQYELLRCEGYTVIDMPRDCVRSFKNGSYGLDLRRLDDQSLLLRIQKGKAVIDRPFSHSERTAPELRLTLELPAVCNPSVALYALKGLCVEQMKIEHSLEAIAGTKLYYLLERCSRGSPEARHFLFI